MIRKNWLEKAEIVPGQVRPQASAFASCVYKLSITHFLPQRQKKSRSVAAPAMTALLSPKDSL